MKATARVLIFVLALVVASAVTAPAAQAQSPTTQRLSAAAVAAPAVAGAVVSVTPARIADSRAGLQIPAPVAPMGTTRVQVTGRGGIPDSGVAAVLATVTVVSPQQAGHLTVWSSGNTRPGTSTLNFQAGQTIANTVLIRVGTGGGIRVFNGSYGSVQVIVDVTGYTRSGTPTAAGAVATLTPARIVDSRVGQQLPGPVPGLAAEDIQIGGQGGIPLTGVAGVVATVTVVDPQQSGHLTLWPSNSPQPGTSNLNFQAGQTIAAMVIVPVSADSALRLFNGSTGTVQVIVDVTGYTLSGTPTAAGTLTMVQPARVADSRVGWQVPGAVPAVGTQTVKVTGIGGVPANGASAVVLTITAVSPQDSGYLTVWPSGDQRPATSNLNFQAGQNIATTVVVPVGPDGQVQLFNGSYGSAHVIVDVSGYSLAATAGGTGGAAWAWGNGTCDQAGLCGALGNGGTADSPLPVPVVGPNNVTAVAGGSAGGYAVHRDGTVWAWGSGYLGQLGNGGTVDSMSPVQVAGLSSVKAIASGSSTGYALRADGTVWAWGYGGMGRLGNGGTVDSLLPVRVSGLTNVIAVAANLSTGYALRSDGTVWAWGWGESGALGNGSTADSAVPVQVSGLTNVIGVAAGGHSGYAVRGDGTAWAWGWGVFGQLGNGGTTDALLPVQVSGLTDVTAIAGGHSTGYAIRGDGTAWAWGDGLQGALGNGGTTSSPLPVQVSGLTAVTAIAGGNSTAYALRSDGTVWAWGWGLVGQLGNGGNADSALPVPVVGLTHVTAIAAGDGTGYAITH